MSREVRGGALEDLGRQILTYGRFTSSRELCERIERVTSEDIGRVAKRVFMEHPMTLVLYGNTASVPSYEKLDSVFRAQTQQK